MEIAFIYAVIAGVVGYLVFGLPAQRIRSRLKVAGYRLEDTRTEPGVADAFLAVRAKATQQANFVFWTTFIVFHVAVVIIMNGYAISVEPRADFMGYAPIYAMIYGPAILIAGVFMWQMTSAVWQNVKAQSFLSVYMQTYPKSSVIREAYEIGRFQAGQTGVTIFAVIGIVVAGLYGIWFVMAMFALAQSAIECARSSKCM